MRHSTNSKRESTNIFKPREHVSASPAKLSINANDFPELSAVATSTAANPSKLSFKSLLNKKNDSVNVNAEDKVQIDPDLVNLEPGWLLIKRDNSNGKIIMKGKIDNITDCCNKTTTTNTTTQPKPEKQVFHELFQSIIETNKKRTDEFIELNGYYTWESMYQFPDYNYNYFDMLDELDAEYEEDDDYEDQDKYDYDYDDYDAEYYE